MLEMLAESPDGWFWIYTGEIIHFSNETGNYKWLQFDASEIKLISFTL